MPFNLDGSWTAAPSGVDPMAAQAALAQQLATPAPAQPSPQDVAAAWAAQQPHPQAQAAAPFDPEGTGPANYDPSAGPLVADLPGAAGAVGSSLASGHAHDDLDAYMLGQGLGLGTAGKVGALAAYAPASVVARGADAVTGAARYADDALQGRLGTDLTDHATVERMVPGAVQTAGLMLPPGMAGAEEGALGAAGGRAFVDLGTGERMHVNAAEARSWASTFDQTAARRQASGADPATVAEAQSAAQALRDALPHLDTMTPDVGGGQFTPAKIMPAGDRAVSVATDPRHAPFEDFRTYRVYSQPDGGLDGVTRARDLGNPLGYAHMKQRDDGRWEVGMVNVNPSARGQGVARDLYSAIEGDLGQKMQPSGVLLPDGYGMWQRRDPEAVQWHSAVTDSRGSTYYLSPRWIDESAEHYAHADPVFAGGMIDAWDKLPAEAKTPEALSQMFTGGLPLPAAQPSAAQPPDDPLVAALMAQRGR